MSYSGDQALIPCNPSAERAVLGACLIDESAIHFVYPILGDDPEVFYDERNRIVYQAMLSLYAQQIPIDFVTLTAEINAFGYGDVAAYVVELMQAVPSAINATMYAELVKREHKRRIVISAASDLAKIAHSAGDELESEVASVLAKLTRESKADGAIGGDRGLEILNEDIAEDAPARGIITGIAPLDERLVPLAGGSLVVLAPTQTGKTQFLLNMMRANARSGYHVVMYFNELDAPELLRRLLVMESVDRSALPPSPPLFTLKDIMYRKAQYRDAMNAVLRKLGEWLHMCTLVPAHGWTAERIVADFTARWLRGECDVVMVDYLDLIPMPRGDLYSEAVGQKMAMLRDGASMCRHADRDPGIPIVIACQPTKPLRDRNGKPGRLSLDDAYGSARIGQFTRRAITLYRPLVDGEPSDVTEVRIEKNAGYGNQFYVCHLMVAGEWATDKNGKRYMARDGMVFYPVEITQEKLEDIAYGSSDGAEEQDDGDVPF